MLVSDHECLSQKRFCFRKLRDLFEDAANRLSASATVGADSPNDFLYWATRCRKKIGLNFEASLKSRPIFITWSSKFVFCVISFKFGLISSRFELIASMSAFSFWINSRIGLKLSFRQRGIARREQGHKVKLNEWHPDQNSGSSSISFALSESLWTAAGFDIGTSDSPVSSFNSFS